MDHARKRRKFINQLAQQVEDFELSETEAVEEYNVRYPVHVYLQYIFLAKTVHKQKNKLDQFYTNNTVAKLCFDKIIQTYQDSFDLYLEPSAGTGAFLDLFPKNRRLGCDLEPKHPEVIKEDFFKFTGPPGKEVAVIGNPPFGRNAGLAIRFFNHAASFNNVCIIAFIIPKTFRKDSVQNRLSMDFKLIVDMDLPKNAFVYEGKEYDVPCCFQIWERTLDPRQPVKVVLTNGLFSFVCREDSNVAVRRVGGRAGKATKNNLTTLPEESYHFLKLKTKILTVNAFVETVNAIDFAQTVNSTAGVRSLSKAELVTKLRSLTSLRGKI